MTRSAPAVSKGATVRVGPDCTGRDSERFTLSGLFAHLDDDLSTSVALVQITDALAPALHAPSSSWLNLVERWFKELTDKQVRRSSFTSTSDLIDTIDEWAEHWNEDPKPFVWHKTAEEIIAKVRRGRAALTHVTKSATDH